MAERLGTAVALLLCAAGCLAFEDGGGTTAGGGGGGGGGGAGGSSLVDACAPGDPTERCAAGERCTWSETERVTDAGRERARLVCAAGGPREELQRCTTDAECRSGRCAAPCPDCPTLCLAPCSTNTQCPASFRCEAGLLRGEAAQFCVPAGTTTAEGVPCTPGIAVSGCALGARCEEAAAICHPEGAPGRPSSLCDDEGGCPAGEACLFRFDAREPESDAESAGATSAVCLALGEAPAPFRRCDFGGELPACESGACEGFCSDEGRPVCFAWHCSTPCGADEDCPFPAVCTPITGDRYGRFAPASLGRCSLDRLCLTDADCDAPASCGVVLRGARLSTACLGELAARAPGEACTHGADCRSRACVEGACRAPCLTPRESTQLAGDCPAATLCAQAEALVPAAGGAGDVTGLGTFCLPP